VSTPQTPQKRDRRGWRSFLRKYRFEIIWFATIAAGVFLIFERLNIRSSIIGWLGWTAGAVLGGVGRLGAAAGALLARITLSDLVGSVLILGALAAILLRVRWRLLHHPVLTLLRCPRCNGPIHRIHRHAADRLISLYVPVRRYSCANNQCRWHGLRVGAGHGASRASTRRPS
jgi:hypothetical protein